MQGPRKRQLHAPGASPQQSLHRAENSAAAAAAAEASTSAAKPVAASCVMDWSSAEVAAAAAAATGHRPPPSLAECATISTTRKPNSYNQDAWMSRHYSRSTAPIPARQLQHGSGHSDARFGGGATKTTVAAVPSASCGPLSWPTPAPRGAGPGGTADCPRTGSEMPPQEMAAPRPQPGSATMLLRLGIVGSAAPARARNGGPAMP